MRLKFHSPKDIKKVAKATIHKSGKLGFTTEAESLLKLNVGKYLKIATDEENTDDDLYIIVTEMKADDVFPVLKAGAYYYINAKGLFRELKLNYTTQRVVFDIEEMEYEGKVIFKFTKRIIKSKNSKPSE